MLGMPRGAPGCLVGVCVSNNAATTIEYVGSALTCGSCALTICNDNLHVILKFTEDDDGIFVREGWCNLNSDFSKLPEHLIDGAFSLAIKRLLPTLSLSEFVVLKHPHPHSPSAHSQAMVCFVPILQYASRLWGHISFDTSENSYKISKQMAHILMMSTFTDETRRLAESYWPSGDIDKYLPSVLQKADVGEWENEYPTARHRRTTQARHLAQCGTQIEHIATGLFPYRKGSVDIASSRNTIGHLRNASCHLNCAYNEPFERLCSNFSESHSSHSLFQCVPAELWDEHSLEKVVTFRRAVSIGQLFSACHQFYVQVLELFGYTIEGSHMKKLICINVACGGQRLSLSKFCAECSKARCLIDGCANPGRLGRCLKHMLCERCENLSVFSTFCYKHRKKSTAK